MAAITYELFFASAGAPSFTTFADDDTDVDLIASAPAISDKGGGFYKFTIDWGTIGASSIRYVVTLGAETQWGLISGNPAPGSVTVTSATRPQNIALFATAGTIISRAAVQLGLGPIADPYASAAPNAAQLCEFLRQAGDDLNTEHDWSNLVQECSFVTDGTTQNYTLPADFHELMSQTMWNRSTRFPVIGPLSAQQSQMLKARLPSMLVNVAARFQYGLLVFPIVPPANATIAFEYVSSYWAMSPGSLDMVLDAPFEGTAAANKAYPTDSNDLVLYDEDLMIAALKLRYLTEKCYDTSAALAYYQKKLEHCIGKDSPQPIVNLANSGGPRADRMIDHANVPDGSWNIG